MTLRERLEELAADWAERRYNYLGDQLSTEAIARNDGREDAIRDAADELCAVLVAHDKADGEANEAERIRLFASYFR